MAGNPFDQFDEPPTAPQAVASPGANPFDQFDEPAAAPDRVPYESNDTADQLKSLALRGVREGARQIGRAGKNVAEGVLGIPLLFANGLTGLADKGLEAVGSDYRLGPVSVGAAVDPDGYLQPQNDVERYGDVIERGLAGAAGGFGVGSSLATSSGPVVSRVGQVLDANRATQGAAAITGGSASQGARDAGYGQGGQALAGFAGALAPGVVSTIGQSAVRGGFRGGEAGRQNVQENLETFARAGTTPSVGQATQTRGRQAAESLLSRAPGGAGPIVAKAEQQAEQLSQGLQARARQLLGRNVTSEQAGREIERGISGPGGFTERFRATQEQLYNNIDQFIPADSPVAVANTTRALQQLTRVIPGAQQTSQRLANPRIAQIAEDVAADAANGTIPYQALRELRTLVGRELADGGIVSDVPRSQWQRLYAGLSQDLGEAARAAGPQAQRAYARANNYTRAGMERIDAIESIVQKNGGPEAVFQAAVAGTKEGATQLRKVMQSLDGQGQRTVTANVVRRLGLSNPGQQNAGGDRFSTETFLTNYSKLSPEAKATLFDRYGNGFSRSMDSVARVAENLRTGSKVFANPSGTQQASTLYGTVGAFTVAALTGQAGVASGILASAGAANLTARLMVNPTFVRWLARSTRFPRGQFAAQVNQLAQSAKNSNDQELAEGVALLEQIQQQEQPR